MSRRLALPSRQLTGLIQLVGTRVFPTSTTRTNCPSLSPLSGRSFANAAASVTFSCGRDRRGRAPEWDGLAARIHLLSRSHRSSGPLGLGVTRETTRSSYIGYALTMDVDSATLDSVVTIAGDLNGDRVVDSNDLDVLRANWGTEEVHRRCSWLGRCQSFDSLVNGDDLDIVRANWGNRAQYAVPEPGCWVLVASRSA